MFCIRKPSESAMRGYIQERQDLPFSYEPANGTQLHSNREEFEVYLKLYLYFRK